MGQNFIDETVFKSLLRSHIVVAVGITFDHLQGFSRVFGKVRY